MYTNFFTQNSTSPYYHNIQYNGVVNELEHKDLVQHTLLGQSNSYGINFTNYYSNQSISSIIKAEKMNNYKNDSQIANQHQLLLQQQDKNIDLGTNQQEQLKDQNRQEISCGEKSRNPSKSLKRIQSDQNIISTFARSTPQFYNLNKPQQIYSQQGLSAQFVNNEGNQGALKGINQQIQNSSSQNDKDKIIKISKIYSTHLMDNKKQQKKISQASQDLVEKYSPQLTKYNKSTSLSNQVTNYVEQQFYSTLMPSFVTKTNNTLNSYRIDENKQLYVFQQQALNFQRKQKKTRSIPTSIYQNSKKLVQANTNIEQSQRTSNTEENEVNTSNLQPSITRQQKNSISALKSESRNHQISIYHRSDSKQKIQQQQGKSQTGSSNTQQSSQLLSHSQSLSNIMNLPKQQKSMSQKNSITYQSILSSINSPQNSNNKQIILQKDLNQNNPVNMNQQNSIQLNISQTQKSDFAMEASPNNETNKNNNLENSSFYQKRKSSSQVLKNVNTNAKKQTSIPSNSYHYKSNSLIIPATSQNTKLQENITDSTQRNIQPYSYKKNQSLYYQSGEKSFQVEKNAQIGDQQRQSQPKRSQESSPQLSASSRIPNSIIKKNFNKTQMINKTIKQNETSDAQLNQQRPSLLIKQQQYQSTLKSENIDDELNYEQIVSKLSQNNMESQISPKRKVVDKQFSKEIKQEIIQKNADKNMSDQKNYENIRFLKQQQQLDQQNKKQFSYSEANNQMKESFSLTNNTSNSNNNTDDKLTENHRFNLKKNFSLNYQENTNDQLFKKTNLIFTQNLQIVHKDIDKDQQNLIIETKKARNLSSSTTLTGNQQNSLKKDVINKTVEGIMLEQQLQQTNKQNKISRSPQRTSQSGQYPDNQMSEYSSRIINNKIDIENKKFLLKQIEQQHQNKYQKNSTFYYQPLNSGKDFSPLASAVANKNFQQDEIENKKWFSEKIQDLGEKNKLWNSNTNNKHARIGSFSIKTQNLQNKEQERDLSPVKFSVHQKQSNNSDVTNQKESPQQSVEVTQQVINNMCSINIYRPKTSEGGSRQRGIRLYSKIRNDNINNIVQNDQNPQFLNQNSNIVFKNTEENKLGQTIKQFYSTHHPIKISKLGSEGSSLQSIFQQKQNNTEKSVYEKINLPSNCYQQQYQKSENQEKNQIQLNKLLVENESDLGIEEFQIEETNEESQQTNEECKQMAFKQQQESVKNNNFISDQDTQNNKILIRYNKSQNQQRREKQQNQDKFPDSNIIQISQHEIKQKPKGSQLQQDFLSLFAQ